MACASSVFASTREETTADGDASRAQTKISRREGINLPGTSSSSLQKRLRVPLGQARSRWRPSEYALRPRAKQRVKRRYGIRERDFRRSFKEVSQMLGDTRQNLLVLLERRLDAAVYRLGFARTRPMHAKW
jgi:small subunit ribosomal protein S4